LSILFVALSIVGFSSAAGDRATPIDAQRRSLIIHVGKAGLYSPLHNEHWVDAPISSGSVDDTNAADT
jgi:hypothetical protein